MSVDASVATTLRREAARGSLLAQRQLVCDCLSFQGGDWRDNITWAEFWARLAAEHGEEHDIGVLVAVFGLRVADAEDRGDLALTHAYSAEALARLTVMADTGHEDAGAMINWLTEAMPLEHVETAKLFLKMWGAK